MKRSDLFSFVNSIGTSPLYFKAIPKPLQNDFQSFMFGRTVGKNKQGQFYAFKIDALEWKHQIINNGLQNDLQIIN